MRVSQQRHQQLAPNGSKLPRGPHALPHETVLAHQRERLLDAVVDGMAECGYADLTVRELIGRAGVSRRTFYEVFDDRLDCILAAHERAFERVSELIVRACRSRAEWPKRAASAIAGALAFAASSPREAQLIVACGHPVSEPKLAAWGRTAHEKLAAVLRSGRKLSPERAGTLELTEQAVIGAVMAIVGDCLVNGGGDAVEELKGELVEIVLTPYVGPAAAKREARSA